jgi:hypothetical protein
MEFALIREDRISIRAALSSTKQPCEHKRSTAGNMQRIRGSDPHDK